MRMFPRAWMALLLLLLLSLPALAEPESFEIEDMVVTGTQQPLKSKDSPANVSTVPADRVRRMRAVDVGELLPQVPGVFIRRSGGTGALATFSVRGSGSTEAQVMMDGRPLNQPSVGNADLSLLPADLVDHVEVVRGPYSALYGPYSMSGSLQLVTKKARPQDGLGRLRLLAGGLGTNAFSGDFHFDLGGGPTLLLVPTVRHGSSGRPNSDSSLSSGFARFDAPLGKSEERHLTLTGGFQSQATGVPGPQPAAGRALRSATQLSLGDDEVSSTIDHQTDHNAFLDGRFTWDGLDAHAYYSSWRPDFHYGYLDWAGSLHLGDSASYQTQAGLDLRYRVPHLEKSAFTVGGLVENSRLEARSSDFDTVWDVRTFSDFDARRQNQALYLEESLQLGSFAAALGARVDHPSDFPTLVSPRASVLWKATDFLSLRGGWGRGYRPPTLYELHLPQTPFSGGNPDLRAQTSTSTEAGLEATLGKGTWLRFTAFREDSRDKITFAPVGGPGPFGPRYIPANLDAFRKVGWEAEITAELAPGLTVVGTHTRLDAVQVNQELVDSVLGTLQSVERPAAYVPQSLSSLVVDWRSRPGGLGILLQGEWVGPSVNYYSNYDQFPLVTQDVKRLPAFSVFDVVISHPVQVGDFEADAFLKVSNLFDQRFSRVFGNDIDDRNYPMPGRAVFFGLSPKL